MFKTLKQTVGSMHTNSPISFYTGLFALCICALMMYALILDILGYNRPSGDFRPWRSEHTQFIPRVAGHCPVITISLDEFRKRFGGSKHLAAYPQKFAEAPVEYSEHDDERGGIFRIMYIAHDPVTSGSVSAYQKIPFPHQSVVYRYGVQLHPGEMVFSSVYVGIDYRSLMALGSVMFAGLLLWWLAFVHRNTILTSW